MAYVGQSKRIAKDSKEKQIFLDNTHGMCEYIRMKFEQGDKVKVVGPGYYNNDIGFVDTGPVGDSCMVCFIKKADFFYHRIEISRLRLVMKRADVLKSI